MLSYIIIYIIIYYYYYILLFIRLCPPLGFEPTISAGERTQTYTLDRAAIGIGSPYRITSTNLP